MLSFDLFDRLRLFALMQAHRGLERRVSQLERQLQRQRSANRQADEELERLRRSSEKLGPLELKMDELRARYSKLRTQLDRPEHRLAERIGRGLRRLRSWSTH
jgi:DNA repair exonuclease SbcCD ATPase subunit